MLSIVTKNRSFQDRLEGFAREGGKLAGVDKLYVIVIFIAYMDVITFSHPSPASRARMMACDRSTTCNLLKMFET